MSDNTEQLRQARRAIEAFFKERASQEGLIVRPRPDVAYLDALDRLFEETVGHRALYIDVGWTRPSGIDVLEKLVPFETGTVDTLTVFVGDPPYNLPMFWRFYRGWLHDGLTAEETKRRAAAE